MATRDDEKALVRIAERDNLITITMADYGGERITAVEAMRRIEHLFKFHNPHWRRRLPRKMVWESQTIRDSAHEWAAKAWRKVKA